MFGVFGRAEFDKASVGSCRFLQGFAGWALIGIGL